MGPAGPMGPAGEQGVAGAPGLPGAQGPAGPAAPAGGLLGYEVVFQDSTLWVSVANNIVVSAFAACPDGKQPLGGGFEPTVLATANNVVFLTPVSSGPSATAAVPPVSGWSVSLRNNSGTSRSNVQFRVWAVCAAQP